ncbi:MAG: transglycosylase domain-containing protein [Clostridia bacterium]|nr:transglycosylase domain-containing protein [Clostridia bacterium]
MEKMFKQLTVWLSLLLSISIILTAFCLPFSKNLKNRIDIFGVNAIADNIKNMEMNMTSVVYVKNAKGDWEEYHRIHGEENRLWVSIDKMPKNLINAFIAIEDETFYEHSGINWKRTLGAVGNMLFKFDETEFGGSTITQQLIKNVTSDKGKNAMRKAREIVRAMLIEKKLNKTQILEAYLNTIALGNGICGVQVAANYYFNKDVSELDLTECATIAAITKNPSRYNPITGMDANKERRKLVLQKMIEWEYIDSEELLNTYDVKIDIDSTQKDIFEGEVNNYFIDTLIEQIINDLMEKYDCTEDIASTMLYNGGYKIYATVDPKIQQSMEKVYTNVKKYFYLKGENLQGEKVHAQSAMTIMDYSGHIVGIVGGAGEKTVNRGLNRAYNVPRQPGSTMKPIGVYALAVENDLIHYTSKVIDQPIDNYYPDGKKGPKEWYGTYLGPITIDYAVRKSANTIPVILLKEMGVEKSYDFLTKKLGMKHLNEIDKNLSSLALGGCDNGITPTESAAAYAIFGNGGVYHEPTTYSKIERINGEVVLEYDTKGTQAISPATATIMNHLLQGVVYGSEGTGGSISGFSSMKAFAKTGTSSDSNDLWMVAGSPYYVGSVWYGFDKWQQVNSTSLAATIWRDVMRDVHRGLETKTFEDSADVYKKGSGYYKKGTTPDNLQVFGGIESSSQISSEASSQITSSSSSTTSSQVSSVESTVSANVSSVTEVSSETSEVSSNESSQPVVSVPTENPNPDPDSSEDTTTEETNPA